jgi:hypothetical protein
LNKINVVFIKYKFIFNKDIKYTSYTYQKVFRDIYGYNQNVTKKNNKVYKYFRKGIINDIPFIKPGKNAIILPIGYKDKLKTYFDNLKYKSNKYDLTYSIEKIDINDESIVFAIEKFINNYYIINLSNKNKNLLNELDNIIINKINDKNYILYILKKCNFLFNINWVNDIKDKSKLVIDLFNKYNIVKQLIE